MNFPPFTKLEGFLSCSQKPTNNPYPEPYKFSPQSMSLPP
jgi:hypothetical protein